MATLIRTRLTPARRPFSLCLLLLCLHCPRPAHLNQTLLAHSSAAPIADPTRWWQEQKIAVDLEWKSADGSRVAPGIAERRDLAQPAARHVLAARRASRGAATTATTSGQDRDIRKSAYVCEDGTLRLSCTAGKHIDVLRANFGRFSITLCNPSGFLDWSVNCASGNSLPVLTQRCTGQAECTVQASSGIFGDPCPTTSKYLEVHYICSSAQEIDSNRSSTARADNDNAPVQGSNRGTKASGEGPASQENSLPSQVLTANQSSMGDVLAADKFAHKAGLNQDLLASSNYLNTHCNQPDSESNHQFASAKCKQMEQPLEPSRDSTESHLEETPSGQQSMDELAENSPETSSTKYTIATSINWQRQKDHKQQQEQRHELHHATAAATNGHLHSLGDQHPEQAERNKPAEWPATHTYPLDKVTSTCQSVIYRGMQWPETAADSVAIQPCPPEASGPARWQCTGAGQGTAMALWNNLPDLSRCNSRWLLELHSFQNVNNFRNDIWKSILTTLQRSTLYGADIVELNSLLHASLQNIFEDKPGHNRSRLNLMAADRQRFAGFETLFETVSLLLDKDNAAWLDLPALKREVTALNLLDITVKYTTLLCLDTRHSSADKEVIKEWPNLLISCYSISKLLHEFRLNWHLNTKNVSREFKFKLFTPPHYQPLVSYANVTVYMVVSADKMASILNEEVAFGTIVPMHLEHYFSVNANRTLELKLQPGLSGLVWWDKSRPSRFINGNVVKFFQFNGSEIVTSGQLDAYWFELVFTHWVRADWLQHQCVHWDSHRNQWSTEQCALLQSNGTHSICRCNIVSTCSLLATEHSTNKSDSDYMPGKLVDQQASQTVPTLAFILFMWLVLLLTRCEDSFFNRFNLTPLLLACIVRTCTELCLISTALWPGWSANWCQTVLLLLSLQMQAVSSLLAVFIFQNAMLTMLASKIYLSKNYANCLHALTGSSRLQICTSPVFALAQLGLLYSVAERGTCWPRFHDTPIMNVFFVLSPLTQLLAVVIVGVAFLHFSQRIFSDYGYPNLHCIDLQTTLLERHVKDLYIGRWKHVVLWIFATCVYVFAVLASQCIALSLGNLSISQLGLDSALALAFLLLVQPKCILALLHKCRQSTPTHCSNKDLSSSSSMHGNSISILSDSSKAFLTLPGQISLSKMLDSSKIYPSPHRSSSTYGRSCNGSMHLYESPKHLYRFECDRYGFGTTVSSAALKHSSSRTNCTTVLPPTRPSSHLGPVSPTSEPTSTRCPNPFTVHHSDCAPSIEPRCQLSMAGMNASLRQMGSTPMYRSHFFDRANFISLN